MRRRPQITESEVVALEERLRTLLAARTAGALNDDEIARYEADRDRLLDLIGDQMREQREYDGALRRLRAEMEQQSGDDGWFSEGHDAAHQARPDAIAHVDDDPTDDRAATEMELRRVEDMINAPYRAAATEAKYADDRDPTGGMWFTPDDTAPGGVRPLTDTEIRRVSGLVRATQADAVTDDLDHRDPPAADRVTDSAADDGGWGR
ncbi:hypothetical protein ND486_08990 [Pseudonocardia sp. DR1-2]|uniref:hypothetical protein n=1 Tax=Pseudonocardia sp. DR1-2 TaxID=2951168 RepID=UPI002044AA03|nr:hypothetical protein [Pseudonocardia sp. DR1-2]MCM3846326.1 hypothetical protein [Pseudonocardia sp. DR1-2]